MSAAIGAALAGARTMTATSLAGARADGRGRLHRRLDARADRDGRRQPRALRPDQHPLRPLGLDADPRLGRGPALRRERAGGVRPDGDRAAARRAPRTSCCRCSSARTASRSPTRPSPSSCSTTTTSRALRRRLRDPASAARRRAPDDAGAVRDARLLLRAPPPAGGRARGGADVLRPSSASEFERSPAGATGAVEPYRLDGAERVIVALGSTAGTVKDVVDELRDEGEPRRPAQDPLVPAVPGASDRAALARRRRA